MRYFLIILLSIVCFSCATPCCWCAENKSTETIEYLVSCENLYKVIESSVPSSDIKNLYDNTDTTNSIRYVLDYLRFNYPNTFINITKSEEYLEYKKWDITQWFSGLVVDIKDISTPKYVVIHSLYLHIQNDLNDIEIGYYYHNFQIDKAMKKILRYLKRNHREYYMQLVLSAEYDQYIRN